MKKKYLSEVRTQELIDEVKRRDQLLGDAAPHWTGTKAELQAEILAGRIKEGTIVCITDDEEIVTPHEVTAEEWEEIFKNAPVTANIGNPVGTIISFMGNYAPTGYLICNGGEYNIVDYQNLANHFQLQFGSKNYFGGDGTTTFKVPDLRGEFLRGTGTNGHTNQGDGANVGAHQDATRHQWLYNAVSNNNVAMDAPAATIYATPQNMEKTFVDSGHTGTKYYSFNKDTTNMGSTTQYTARPTNTSVLYCIKY